MKKHISLILVVLFVCTAFVSCGKAPDFIPISDIAAATLSWASATGKDINKEEYVKGFIDAYNSVTETEKYDEGDNADAEWRVVLVSEEEGKEPDVVLVSYLGDNRFNVSVNGSAAAKASEDKTVKYLVVNEALAEFAEVNLLSSKSVSAAVKVAFSFEAGTPDAEGKVREADEDIGETEQTVVGNEEDRPTVSDAVRQALMLGGVTDDYVMHEGASGVESINGCDEYINSDAETGKTEILKWQISLNGEVLPSGSEASTEIADGDEITVTYVVTTPDNAG